MMRLLKSAYLWTMLALLVVLAGSVAWRLNERKEASRVNPYPTGLVVEDYDEFLESKKEVESDIEGMSQYDKHIAGLDWRDGSDTDHDGLTDKEEIEVYGSDPLKPSTSGDLYSDKYKVEHGMDLNKSYEYDEEMEFPNLECPEVSVVPSDPTDFSVVVKDCTQKYDLSTYGVEEVYKGYSIYNYSGRVKVDLGKALENSNADIDDVKAYWTEGPYLISGASELRELGYSKSGNIVELDLDFEDDGWYLVFFAEKKGFSVGAAFDGLIEKLGIDMNGISISKKTSTKSNKGKVDAMMWGPTLLQYITKKGMHVEYVAGNSERETDAIRNKLKERFFPESGIESSTVKEVSQIELELRRRAFDMVIPFCKVVRSELEGEQQIGLSWLIPRIFFIYENYEEDFNMDEEIKKEGKAGFDKYVDEFPFTNFGSYINGGGNCAGITHFVCQLYNDGKVQTKGSYEIGVDGNEVSWDISKDEENSTLLDAGIFDYKDAGFVGNDGMLKDELSASEDEFVKMIGCYWAEGNEHANLGEHILEDGEYDDYKLVKKMMKQLDKGKVLDMYFKFADGHGGHAVNVYGYEKDGDDVRFYIYDSNFPQDERDGYDLGEGCVFITRREGDGESADTFEYMYQPVEGNVAYMATSEKGMSKTHAIVVMDEDWNVLNAKKESGKGDD